MKRTLTKNKVEKVTLESISENLDKFQSLVVGQFGKTQNQFEKIDQNFVKVWDEFAEVKDILSGQRKDIQLIQNDLFKIQSKLENIESRLDIVEKQAKNNSQYSVEIDDLRKELKKIYKILEVNGIKFK